MFPIEMFSHLARILSLTGRLFANMFAGEMSLWFSFLWFLWGSDLFFRAAHRGGIHTDLYFCASPCVYLGEAIAHEH